MNEIYTVIISLAAGGLISFFIARRFERKKALYYAIDTDVVFRTYDSASVNDIQVLYGGEEVEKLCRSFVFVWNRDQESIRRADLVETDPLRVVLPEGARVLRITPAIANRQATSPQVMQNDCELWVDFEILDQGDAIAFTYYWDAGGVNKEISNKDTEEFFIENFALRKVINSVEMKGSVAGVPSGVTDSGYRFFDNSRIDFMVNIGFLAGSIFLVALCVYLFAPSIWEVRSIGGIAENWVSVLGLMVAFFVGFFPIRFLIRGATSAYRRLGHAPSERAKKFLDEVRFR